VSVQRLIALGRTDFSAASAVIDAAFRIAMWELCYNAVSAADPQAAGYLAGDVHVFEWIAKAPRPIARTFQLGHSAIKATRADTLGGLLALLGFAA
jgi:hypothetical protein